MFGVIKCNEDGNKKLNVKVKIKIKILGVSWKQLEILFNLEISLRYR